MKTITFHPAEQLTFATAESEHQRFLTCLNQAALHDQCRIDLRGVTHCDSAGLALLIEAKRVCNQHQISLEVCDMPDFMRFLAEFSNIDSFF